MYTDYEEPILPVSARRTRTACVTASISCAAEVTASGLDPSGARRCHFVVRIVQFGVVKWRPVDGLP